MSFHYLDMFKVTKQFLPKTSGFAAAPSKFDLDGATYTICLPKGISWWNQRDSVAIIRIIIYTSFLGLNSACMSTYQNLRTAPPIILPPFPVIGPKPQTRAGRSMALWIEQSILIDTLRKTYLQMK